MKAWEFIFGHVTRDTFTGADRARRPGTIMSRLEPGFVQVTAKAALIVGCLIPRQRQMWVVARDAGKLSIAFSPASAFLQPVGLKAHRGNACHAAEQNIPGGSMAGAAEVNRVHRIKAGRVQNQLHALLDAAIVYGCYMTGPWTVAGFTADSWNNMFQVELAAGG